VFVLGNKSKEISEFQKTHGLTDAEMWEVRPGSWAIKHSAIERVVAERGIKFERPAIIEVNTAEKIMVICVFGTLGDRTEWSFGEASPANCKIAYPASIAEKRAKDRVAIKLLNATGSSIYSSEEADEFAEPAKRQNPHVTRPEDVYDGEVSHDIPEPDGPVQKMKVKNARVEYPALLKEMHRCQDAGDLLEWALARKADIQALPGEWPQHFRIEYTKHKNSLTQPTLMAG
jgi:hypothetical protein